MKKEYIIGSVVVILTLTILGCFISGKLLENVANESYEKNSTNDYEVNNYEIDCDDSNYNEPSVDMDNEGATTDKTDKTEDKEYMTTKKSEDRKEETTEKKTDKDKEKTTSKKSDKEDHKEESTTKKSEDSKEEITSSKFDDDKNYIYVMCNSSTNIIDKTKKVGSISNPFTSLQEALDAAEPGNTIMLRKGTYTGGFKFNKSGDEREGYITVSSYKNEAVTITTKNGVNGAAFSMNGQSYIKLENMKIANLKAKSVYGILMTGSESYIYINNCEFSNIVTTQEGSSTTPGGEANAILLFGEGKTAKNSINHIYINKNKVHNNINGWSENISIAGNCEYIYVKNNYVYDNTNIGIDFYGNAEYCEDKSLDQPRHCECTGNKVYNCNSKYAANAGIYVDGAYDVLISGNEVHNNFYGIEIGSEEWRSFYDKNNQVRKINVINNKIYDNINCGISIGGWTNDSSTGIVRDCVIKDNIFHANGKNDGAEIVLNKCDNIEFKNNRFDNGNSYKEVVYWCEEIDKLKITNIKFDD